MAALRSFGRFRLLRLEGKSRRSMAWRVFDPASGKEMLLVLPRTRPAESGAATAWDRAVRRAGRLEHPNLAEPVEIGSHERWPYVLYAAGPLQTLQARLQQAALAPAEAARVIAAAARALAFAHEGQIAHRDLQPYLLLLGDGDQLQVLGLAVGQDLANEEYAHGVPHPAGTHVEALDLQGQRAAARDDVLALGLLLHLALAGSAALDEADIGLVAERLPPHGRDLIRLPWNPERPMPDALRAIANRATDRQPRQRYGSARSLQRALEGWLQADNDAEAGPAALLLERMHAVGTLPAAPGAAERVARLAFMDRERTAELAEVVLQDLALSFELLRWVNTAQLRDLPVSGHGPVLTVRRAIAMIGVDGVRRAALGLRDWPGPLAAEPAQALQRWVARVQRAGRLAQALRPAGYDAEVVCLVTLLQNLGRLLCAYHLPDEMQQIQRLMQAVPGDDGQPVPGMDEQSAAYAVLGTDVEALGAAVARQWGYDAGVLLMIRRLPAGTLPRAAEGDDAMLRAVASCANECIDAMTLDEAARGARLRRVVQRYGRMLGLSLRDLQRALGLPQATTARGDDGPADGHPVPEPPALDAREATT